MKILSNVINVFENILLSQPNISVLLLELIENDNTIWSMLLYFSNRIIDEPVPTTIQ